MKYDRRAAKRLRLRRGVKVDALARRARVTPNALRLIERGVSQPRADTLAKLAGALEVGVEAFFDGGKLSEGGTKR